MYIKEEFNLMGFTIIPEMYSSEEITSIKNALDNYFKEDVSKPIHAIRQVVEKIPELEELLWNQKLKSCLSEMAGHDYFLTKGIYFDKPEKSNWFVSYHQDLSISVSEKKEIIGYKNWTKKGGQIGVEPPVEILENIVTFRIHLDQTDETNGALRVIPKSHLNGVKRIENLTIEEEVICNVPEGGVMLMKPLTFHASGRSTESKRRRVIHLEFSNATLATPLKWHEKRMI